MVSYRKYSVQSKISLDNAVLKRINKFSYLEYVTIFWRSWLTRKKCQNLTNLFGKISRIFKASRIQKSTCTQIYKLLALLTLCYGSESRIIRKRYESRLTSGEKRFMCWTGSIRETHHALNNKMAIKMTGPSKENEWHQNS